MVRHNKLTPSLCEGKRSFTSDPNEPDSDSDKCARKMQKNNEPFTRKFQ